jgi:O-antigen/teichoic acid export membrane protein
MLAGGVAVMFVAPLLFHVAFEGRYDDGLAVLPFTLTYCVWYGLLIIGQTYLWCAERMKAGAVPLAVGLAVNIFLNLLLIPAWGLTGAVVATTIATGLALAVLHVINHHVGMKFDPGVVWLSLAPAAMCGGAWTGAIALMVLAVILPWSRVLINQSERDAIGALLTENLAKLRELYPGVRLLRIAPISARLESRAAAKALGRGCKPTEA